MKFFAYFVRFTPSIILLSVSTQLALLTKSLNGIIYFLPHELTVNPPYFKAGHGIVNPSDTKTISRHEVACTLRDVLSVSRSALKDGGYFFMVHKPQRLTDVLFEMRSAGLEPKTLKTVYPKISASALVTSSAYEYWYGE